MRTWGGSLIRSSVFFWAMSYVQYDLNGRLYTALHLRVGYSVITMIDVAFSSTLVMLTLTSLPLLPSFMHSQAAGPEWAAFGH